MMMSSRVLGVHLSNEMVKCPNVCMCPGHKSVLNVSADLCAGLRPDLLPHGYHHLSEDLVSDCWEQQYPSFMQRKLGP